MFNQILHTEMEIFLGQADQTGNKRNGYDEREYALKGVGCVRIRMPVDRKKKFQERCDPTERANRSQAQGRHRSFALGWNIESRHGNDLQADSRC
ncbi:MAG: hypothetical protein IPK68_10815 [Bdellovibrionales bacterium]|nr:hypothetical protein [Bdellovibrionales bacterium]